MLGGLLNPDRTLTVTFHCNSPGNTLCLRPSGRESYKTTVIFDEKEIDPFFVLESGGSLNAETILTLTFHCILLKFCHPCLRENIARELSGTYASYKNSSRFLVRNIPIPLRRQYSVNCILVSAVTKHHFRYRYKDL